MSNFVPDSDFLAIEDWMNGGYEALQWNNICLFLGKEVSDNMRSLLDQGKQSPSDLILETILNVIFTLPQRFLAVDNEIDARAMVALIGAIGLAGRPANVDLKTVDWKNVSLDKAMMCNWSLSDD